MDLQTSFNQAGAIFAATKALVKAALPDTGFKYNTAETVLLGEVIRAATGKNLADYLSEKIWQPLGMEADATWGLDSPGGHEIAGAGISAVARDYVRFGQFLLNGAIVDGKKMVPDWWMAEAASPREIGVKTVFYGYQLWVVNPEIHGATHSGAYEAKCTFIINAEQSVSKLPSSSGAKNNSTRLSSTIRIFNQVMVLLPQ